MKSWIRHKIIPYFRFVYNLNSSLSFWFVTDEVDHKSYKSYSSDRWQLMKIENHAYPNPLFRYKEKGNRVQEYPIFPFFYNLNSSLSFWFVTGEVDHKSYKSYSSDRWQLMKIENHAYPNPLFRYKEKGNRVQEYPIFSPLFGIRIRRD